MISVIIVTRNEADYIEECLSSVVAQFSSCDPDRQAGQEFELVIVDGMSDDATFSLAKNWCKKNGVRPIFIQNPSRTLATGWNLGIKHSKGEYIIRPDAHATLHPGYVSACMDALNRFPDAGAAGGRLETKSKGRVGDIISKVLSSRVGVGNSSFRTSRIAGFQDTVVYGTYRRTVFDSVGLFNESLTRHQDTEFHRRMKEAEFGFYFQPEAVAEYYCRKTIPSLIRQYFNIGYYLPDLISVGHAKAIRPRHLAPALFYLTFMVLILSGTICKPCFYLGLGVFVSYLAVLAAEAVRISTVGRKFAYLAAFFIFIVVHFSYATGTVAGLLKRNK